MMRRRWRAALAAVVATPALVLVVLSHPWRREAWDPALLGGGTPHLKTLSLWGHFSGVGLVVLAASATGLVALMLRRPRAGLLLATVIGAAPFLLVGAVFARDAVRPGDGTRVTHLEGYLVTQTSIGTRDPFLDQPFRPSPAVSATTSFAFLAAELAALLVVLTIVTRASRETSPLSSIYRSGVRAVLIAAPALVLLVVSHPWSRELWNAGTPEDRYLQLRSLSAPDHFTGLSRLCLAIAVLALIALALPRPRLGLLIVAGVGTATLLAHTAIAAHHSYVTLSHDPGPPITYETHTYGVAGFDSAAFAFTKPRPSLGTMGSALLLVIEMTSILLVAWLMRRSGPAESRRSRSDPSARS